MATHHLKEQTKSLVAQFCAGNDHAFATLYDLYVPILFNYGIRLTENQELLKDCIHDVFVKVYKKRDEQFSDQRSACGTALPIRNFASYLVISLKNRLLDEFRRQTFSSDTEIEAYEYRRAADDVEDDYLTMEQRLLQSARVAGLMRFLTRRQRQAITLYYLEERKYEEICGIMQMNYQIGRAHV